MCIYGPCSRPALHRHARQHGWSAGQGTERDVRGYTRSCGHAGRQAGGWAGGRAGVPVALTVACVARQEKRRPNHVFRNAQAPCSPHQAKASYISSCSAKQVLRLAGRPSCWLSCMLVLSRVFSPILGHHTWGAVMVATHRQAGRQVGRRFAPQVRRASRPAGRQAGRWQAGATGAHRD